MTCQNQGYLKPYRDDSKDCECQCPPNTSGKNCEMMTRDDYYDSLWDLPCGSNLTTESLIQTPDFPNRTQPKQSCVWHVRVSFRSFFFPLQILFCLVTSCPSRCITFFCGLTDYYLLVVVFVFFPDVMCLSDRMLHVTRVDTTTTDVTIVISSFLLFVCMYVVIRMLIACIQSVFLCQL